MAAIPFGKHILAQLIGGVLLGQIWLLDLIALLQFLFVRLHQITNILVALNG